MPPGRKPNYDAKIGNLLDQLRSAIIAREKAAMDARVSEQVRALVSSLDSGTGEMAYRRLERAVKANGVAKTPAKKRGRRSPMSAAEKKVVSERMKKYWAERRKQKEAK